MSTTNDPLIALADAITAAIDAHEWGVTPAATIETATYFLPVTELGDADPGTFSVRVVPAPGDDTERVAAGRYKNELTVEVWFQRKLAAKTTDAADESQVATMIEASGEIKTLLLGAALTVLGRSAWCIKATRRPAFDDAVFDEYREFLGRLETTWRILG
ncbi:MAG: hypothetical protein ABFD84_13675 [Candidatus Polarisedimenticolia bacterium]